MWIQVDISKPSLFIPSEGYPMFPRFQLDILILSHVREFDLALFQSIVDGVPWVFPGKKGRSVILSIYLRH